MADIAKRLGLALEGTPERLLGRAGSTPPGVDRYRAKQIAKSENPILALDIAPCIDGLQRDHLAKFCFIDQHGDSLAKT